MIDHRADPCLAENRALLRGTDNGFVHPIRQDGDAKPRMHAANKGSKTQRRKMSRIEKKMDNGQTDQAYGGQSKHRARRAAQHPRCVREGKRQFLKTCGMSRDDHWNDFTCQKKWPDTQR